MFSGIVEELGCVESLRKEKGALRLGIKAESILQGLKTGESIAVNGVCLTVVEIASGVIFFDCIQETTRLSNLGGLRLKERVNLERSLRADGSLNGHFVLGHIDGQGKIVKRVSKSRQTDLHITAEEKILSYLIPKGSIALDGVSLTLLEIRKESFSVALIPHTLKMTTLGLKGAGDYLNIEVDVLGKYVKRFLELPERNKSKITLEFLRSQGFV